MFLNAQAPDGFGVLQWHGNTIMTIETLAIVAGGNLSDIFFREIRKADYIIAADRGAIRLIENDITPDISLGDFDSVTKKELITIKQKSKKVIQYISEKDETDLEIGLKQAIPLHPRSIIIYGATGTRSDHMVASLMLLETCNRHGINTMMRDETNDIICIGKGEINLTKRADCLYVYIVPISQSVKITERGFRYEITNKTIHRGQTLGISNEFIGNEATIILHRGRAFLIQSRD